MRNHAQSSPGRPLRPTASKIRHVPASSSSIAPYSDNECFSDTPSRIIKTSINRRPLVCQVSQPSLQSNSSKRPLASFEAPRTVPPLPSPLPLPSPAYNSRHELDPAFAMTSRKHLQRKAPRRSNHSPPDRLTRAKDAQTNPTATAPSRDSDESSILCSIAAEFDETLARHDRVVAAARERAGLEDPETQGEDSRKHRQLWADNLFDKLTKRFVDSRFLKDIYRKREKSSSLGRAKDFTQAGGRTHDGTDTGTDITSSPNNTNLSAMDPPLDGTSSSQSVRQQLGQDLRPPRQRSQSCKSSRPLGQNIEGPPAVPRSDKPNDCQKSTQENRTSHEPRRSQDSVKHATSTMTAHSSSTTKTREGEEVNTVRPSQPSRRRRSESVSSMHARNRSSSRVSLDAPPTAPPAFPIPPLPTSSRGHSAAVRSARRPTLQKLPQQGDRHRRNHRPRRTHTSGTIQCNQPAQYSSPSVSHDGMLPFPSSTHELKSSANDSPALADPFMFTAYEGGKTDAPKELYLRPLPASRSSDTKVASNGVRDTFGALNHEDSEMLEELITQAELGLLELPRWDPTARQPLDMTPAMQDDCGRRLVQPEPAHRSDEIPFRSSRPPSVDEEHTAAGSTRQLEQPPGSTSMASRLASRIRTLSSTSAHSRSFLTKKRSAKPVVDACSDKVTEHASDFSSAPFTLGLKGTSITPSSSNTGSLSRHSLTDRGSRGSSVLEGGLCSNGFTTPSTSISDLGDHVVHKGDR
ncbi:unnamed protein product [Sympodiomycopsis kandeliae]